MEVMVVLILGLFGIVMFDHEGEFYGCFAGDDDVNGLS